MADEIKRYDTPKPRNGIGKSGVLAIVISVACFLAATIGGIQMALSGQGDEPAKDPTYSEESSNPTNPEQGETTTPTNPEQGETTNPGGDTTKPEEDVVRDLTEEEKKDIVIQAMLGEGYIEYEGYTSMVNSDCVIEIDGQEVEGIKLIYEAKVTREDGLVDHRVVSAAVEKNAENENMTPDELAVYIYNKGTSSLVVKNDEYEGTFVFGEDTVTKSIEGSKSLRDSVKDGKTVTEDGYNKIDCLRENLCNAAGKDADRHNAIVTDFFEQTVNDKGDVEFVLMYQIYSLDGKLVGHYMTVFASDAEFAEVVKNEEILSGTNWKFSDVADTIQVDRNGMAIDLVQDRAQ